MQKRHLVTTKCDKDNLHRVCKIHTVWFSKFKIKCETNDEKPF